MEAFDNLIGTIAPATASAAANSYAGNDGVFVWIFLGFFALIVVGQLIPAVMLIIGVVRGVASKSKAKIKEH